MEYDVAIAGAGPAGASLAIRLAASGRRVLLVEQKSFPRPKLCGEFISPECLSHFEELGLDLRETTGGVDIDKTVLFARSGRSVVIENGWFGAASPTAFGLSRAEMDASLLGRARETGVDVRDDTAASLVVNHDKVTGLRLKNGISEETIDAPFVVDATGRTRSLARRFDSGAASRADHVAFKAHLTGARIDNAACEIYGYAGGYGGCSRIEDGLYNLCFIVASADAKRCGSDPVRAMREIVCGNRRAESVLSGASVVSEWLAVPIERFGRRSLVPAEGLMTIGDSAAFIDPFTGSGILLALESARIAADAIASSREFADAALAYSRCYSSIFDRRLRVSSFLRHSSFSPVLAELLIAVLSVSRTLRRRVAQATR